MHIIVCVKQVPDPESSPARFVVDEQARRVEPRGVPPVLNPFDENALEAALRMKDVHGDGAAVTILTLGHKISTNLMLKALGAGGDRLVRIEDDAFAPGQVDVYATCMALAAAARKVAPYDLILVGEQAADSNDRQAGVGIAHVLGIPVVTMARNLELRDGALWADRRLANRRERVKCQLPAVVAVSSDGAPLRYPSLVQLKAARSKPVQIWNAQDIGFDAQSRDRRLALRRIYAPRPQQRDCVMIGAESGEQAGRMLAAKLREDAIL